MALFSHRPEPSLNSIQNPALGQNSVQNPALGAGLEARFAAAARHSRMVRVLRVAVPAAVLLAMAGIVAVSVFNPFRMPTAETARRHRQSRGIRHQDHDGIAAPRRLLDRPAALRIVGQGRDPGSDRPRSRRTQDAAGQGHDGGQEHGDDGCPHRVFRQQAAAAGSAQGYLPAILHRLRGQTLAGLCRHQQGIGDVGRACRRQIAEWNAHGRQAQDHQQRRGGALRRQCRDEPDHGKPRRRPEPEPEPPPPPKTRSVTGKSANTK